MVSSSRQISKLDSESVSNSVWLSWFCSRSGTGSQSGEGGGMKLWWGEMVWEWRSGVLCGVDSGTMNGDVER